MFCTTAAGSLPQLPQPPPQQAQPQQQPPQQAQPQQQQRKLPDVVVRLMEAKKINDIEGGQLRDILVRVKVYSISFLL